MSASICPNLTSPEFLNRDTPAKRSFGLFIYVFGQIFLTGCLITFCWGKYIRQYERLRKRHAILFLSVYVGAMIHHQGSSLEMVIGPANYPCVVKLTVHLLIIPFVGAGIIGKLVSFFFRTRFEQQAIEAMDETRGKPDTQDFEQRTKHVFRTMAGGAKELFLFRENANLTLGSLRFLQSGVATLLLLVVIFLIPAIIVVVIAATVDPVMISGCSGCTQSYTVVTFLIVQSVGAAVLLLAALVRARRLPDNFGIISETLLVVFFSAMAVIGYGLDFFLPSDYEVWSFIFILAVGIWGIVGSQSILQVILASRTEKNYPGSSRRRQGNRVGNDAGLTTSFRMQSGHDLTRSSSQLNFDKLAGILADPEMARKFEEFLAREFGVESLFFYKDAKRWAQEYNDVSVSTRKARAKHIVNVYIRGNGVFAINVPSNVSKSLIATVEAQHDPPPDFFAEAIAEIQELLDKGAVVRFRAKERLTSGSYALNPSSTA